MRHAKNTRVLQLLFGLVGAAALASTASCGAATADAGEGDDRAVVAVHTIQSRDMQVTMQLVADLQPAEEVSVYSPVNDRILAVEVVEGQAVRRGQRLVLVRREAMNRGLEQLDAQLEALDVQLANQEQELARAQRLLLSGVVTQQAHDQAETAVRANQAQRKALVASRAQLAVNAGNAVVTAPISGVVADLAAERGDMAMPQQRLMSIISVDRLLARVRVPEADVGKLRTGMPAHLSVSAHPRQTFSGKVARIAPRIDSTSRTNLVEISVDNPSAGNGAYLLRPGMFGTITAVVQTFPGALVVPQGALVLDDQLLARQQVGQTLRRVFVVDAESVAQERLVELGVRNGAFYQVLSGLEVGERVVTRGQFSLTNEQVVRTTPPNAQSLASNRVP